MARLTDSSPDAETTAGLVREAATDLTGQIVAYFRSEQTPINESIFVPLLIIARIIRTHDAIQLLLKHAHVSEAAVLTLTQFELRLDLAYTAHEPSHATEWAAHENMRWSVAQKMETKIKGLFSEHEDRKRLTEIFYYLSGIKHGNPLYSALGFPARGNGLGLEISTGEIVDEFSEEFSRKIASYSKYQLAWSSQVLNVCTGQYAVVDTHLRHAIRDFYLKLVPDEEVFRQYLAKLVTQNQGPFGLKLWKRKGVG